MVIWYKNRKIILARANNPNKQYPTYKFRWVDIDEEVGYRTSLFINDQLKRYQDLDGSLNIKREIVVKE
jgi:hypothetical protein